MTNLPLSVSLDSKLIRRLDYYLLKKGFYDYKSKSAFIQEAISKLLEVKE